MPDSSREGKEGEDGKREAHLKKKHVKVTPLPKLQMVAVCATLLTEAVCTTMLLPFVGLFISFLRGVSAESAGYASGMLVGLFMLGQVVSGKYWGWISDCYGRKFPLCCGLISAAFIMLLFGMSPNFFFCCVMRFIHGILNGNILIAKIIISDITDETNKPVGFAMVGLLWSVGGVIGPAVGGFLYDPLVNPKLKFLHVQEGSFLARNPAFLPSAFVFIYTVAAFFVVLLVVPETNKNRTKSLRSVFIIGWFLNRFHPKEVTVTEVRVMSSELNCVEGDGTEGRRGSASPLPPQQRTMSYREALKDPIIRYILIFAMCLGAADMSFSQILPLQAIAAHEVGGLGMFSDTVGLLMLSFAVPTFIVSLSFPTVYRKVANPYYIWRAGSTIFSIAIILTPFGSKLGSRSAFWFVLLMGSIKQGIGSACFTLINISIVNAAFPGTVGSVYGILQSLTALVRCIVPFIVAPLFAWSISGHHIFPFNHYLVFFLSVVPVFCTVYLSFVVKLVRPKSELEEVQPKMNNENERTEIEVDVEKRNIEDREEQELLVRYASMEDCASLFNSFASSLSEASSASQQLTNAPKHSSPSRRTVHSVGIVQEWIHDTPSVVENVSIMPSTEMLMEEDVRVLDEETLKDNP